MKEKASARVLLRINIYPDGENAMHCWEAGNVNAIDHQNKHQRPRFNQAQPSWDELITNLVVSLILQLEVILASFLTYCLDLQQNTQG